MGSKDNQDYYKVAGTKIEDRGIARRDRRRLGEDTAQLQNKASAKSPTPETTRRKTASASKPKKKETTSSDTVSPPKKATKQPAAANTKSPKLTTRAKTGAEPRTKQSKISKQAPKRAELAGVQRQGLPAPQKLEDLSNAKPWRQAKHTADKTGQWAKRLATLAVDVALAPWTVIRLARQLRRRENQNSTPHSKK